MLARYPERLANGLDVIYGEKTLRPLGVDLEAACDLPDGRLPPNRGPGSPGRENPTSQPTVFRTADSRP